MQHTRGLILALCCCGVTFGQEPRQTTRGRAAKQGDSRRAAIRGAAQTAGLAFDDDEIQLMLRTVGRNLRSFETLRRRALPNAIAPALTFSAFLPGIGRRAVAVEPDALTLPKSARPKNLDALAFADIPTLAALIRSRQVSCVELTKFFLARLRKLDPKLHCVIHYTEKRALETAAARDAELADGKWRGLLHGIPYGAKDLLAAKGAPTTWGATPFRDQIIDRDAAVIRKLEQAGAVLVAKLSLGALAWGDVWFGGRTRNPWDPTRGSSGSSAGPASATAAGAVPFALGSETLGSIVSPSAECGCTSLRPTFGRVSRDGAMALSWSMDKLGPLCRSVRDAAIVFAAIQGPATTGETDAAVFARPFRVPRRLDIHGFRVGVLRGSLAKDAPIRIELAKLGVEFVEISLPRYPTRDMVFILNVEGAAAFDELTRSGRDDELVRQQERAWPNVFRAARLVPAVEYLQANRLRTQLMREFDAVMAKVDVLVHPPFAGGILTMTNLTGHPTVVAPYRMRAGKRPGSICFTGQLADEERLLGFCRAWQETTPYHTRHPRSN